MTLSSILYFLSASVLITFAPGPDNMYLLAKSLSSGARDGIALAGGLASGIVFHTALVIIGIAALIQASPTAFTLLKYLGAAYLLYIAWQACHAKSSLTLQTAAPAAASRLSLYQRGIMMNVMNPKVLLFFLAFLPQFVAPDATMSAGCQTACLGAIFSLQAFLIFSGIAICAGKVRHFMLHIKNLDQILGRLQGIILASIALFLILS
jgi:threonine/homoserine/homoserine lactone efflux protein